MLILIVLGIAAWLFLGWLGGYVYRKDHLKMHLGWGKTEELYFRLLISLGIMVLLAVFITRWITGNTCLCLSSEDKEYCVEYLAYSKNRYPSWFGKSSGYDKIPHPELSVNL